MPEVSVIMPTYNRAELLKKSVRSVLNQTYQDFELIIVDDGSTDDTEGTVKSFGDKRVSYIRHERNRGPGAARNAGIRAAKGKYVAFQDSDDEWLPQKLDRQIRVMMSAPPDVGVVYTGFRRIEAGGRIYEPLAQISEISAKEGDIHNALLRGNFIGTPVVLARSECFDHACMFAEELPMLEDWELWIRISKRYRFTCIDEPMVISYSTPGSINKVGTIVQAHAIAMILKRHFKDFKRHPRLLAGYSFTILRCILSAPLRQLKGGR